MRNMCNGTKTKREEKAGQTGSYLQAVAFIRKGRQSIN